jgi:hypothetical protein
MTNSGKKKKKERKESRTQTAEGEIRWIIYHYLRGMFSSCFDFPDLENQCLHEKKKEKPLTS